MPLVDFQQFRPAYGAVDEIDTMSARMDAARQEGWEQGYLDGQNAAIDDASQSQVQVEQLLCQSISALQSELADYQRERMADLKPLLMDLASYLLPRVAKEVLAPQLVDLLSGALSRWLAAPLVIAAHPDSLCILQRAVAQLPADKISWVAEPDFSLSRLELRQDDKMRRLDLGEAAQQMIVVLERYFDIDLLEQEYATTSRG